MITDPGNNDGNQGSEGLISTLIPVRFVRE